MDDVQKMKKHYEEHFDPEQYRNKIVLRDGLKMREEEKFFFKSMWEIFQDPKFRGTSLLDVGSGPTVHNVAPASAFYTHIVLGEFVESSRDELQKWLRADPDALDWSRLLNEAAEAEGFSALDAGRREIEARIRKSVKSVVPCDLLAEKIVPPEADVEYDLVMTSLTLEAVSPDYDTFASCLRKIYSLLKPGGRLIMKGFTNAGMWASGDHKFPYLRLKSEDIEKALETNRFGDIQWKFMERKDSHYAFDFDGCYVVSCVKQT